MSNYFISKGSDYIYNLNQCQKESIYIFFNEEERIYIIKQKYYQIKDRNLINIKQSNINQKENFESRIINKIEQKKNKGKESKI